MQPFLWQTTCRGSVLNNCVRCGLCCRAAITSMNLASCDLNPPMRASLNSRQNCISSKHTSIGLKPLYIAQNLKLHSCRSSESHGRECQVERYKDPIGVTHTMSGSRDINIKHACTDRQDCFACQLCACLCEYMPCSLKSCLLQSRILPYQYKFSWMHNGDWVIV